jgi:hypothetical protein
MNKLAYKFISEAKAALFDAGHDLPPEISLTLM